MVALIAVGVIAALVLLFIFLPVVAWILVGLVLLILAVVLFVPIGADVGYVGGAFSLALRADGFAIQLIPKKPKDPDKEEKKKKEKKEKPKKEKKPKEPKPEGEKKKKKLDFTLEEIIELVRKVINGLGKFGKLTVRRFMLHYIAAGKDPYDTAMTYNYVNAALSTMAPVCARKFRVKGAVDVWTDIDFTRENMLLDTELSITLRVAQLVHVALAVAVGALGILIKNRRRLKKEKRLEKKQQSQHDGVMNTENKEPQTIQAEERND